MRLSWLRRGYEEAAVGLLLRLEQLQTAAEDFFEYGVVEDARLASDVPVLQLQVVRLDVDAELAVDAVDCHGHRGEEGFGEGDEAVARGQLDFDHRVREVLGEAFDDLRESLVEPARGRLPCFFAGERQSDDAADLAHVALGHCWLPSEPGFRRPA